MKNSVRAAGPEAQYDEKVKRLLGNKYILAYILIKTVDEFAGMKAEDVVPYIEGEPLIGEALVEPGLTNTKREETGQRIVGFNSENVEINEGMVRFDIVFYAHMKDGLSRIIVNVEAQKDEPVGYDILNRAIFYVSRLISSQKERDFVNTNYNDIKCVFSIWICMNMDKNSMNYVHLTDEKLLGSYEWKGRLDLLNIVLLGLSNELPEQDGKYGLHRLLGALLSMELSTDEKLNIMETEYDIPMEDNIREDVSVMCNLSQGILEKGMKKGMEKGEAGIILNMYKKGFTVQQLADITDKAVEEIKTIVEKQDSLLA